MRRNEGSTENVSLHRRNIVFVEARWIRLPPEILQISRHKPLHPVNLTDVLLDIRDRCLYGVVEMRRSKDY